MYKFTFFCFVLSLFFLVCDKHKNTVFLRGETENRSFSDFPSPISEWKKNGREALTVFNPKPDFSLP